MDGQMGDLLWNLILMAATALLATVFGALIGWKNYKPRIEKFVENNRPFIVVVTGLVMFGLVGVWAQRYLREEPDDLIELSPARQQFDPQLGYYWVCAGDITIRNDVTEATLEARAFVDQIPTATPKTTGIVTTIDLVDLPEHVSVIDLSIVTSGMADCWSATDEDRIYIESSVNQLVKESPNYICGQSKCEEYIPYYPDLVALILGTPQLETPSGTAGP